MVSVVLELFAGITLIGALMEYQRKKTQKQKPQIYGRFCICYTKGDHFSKFTYVPWITRVYKTSEDLEYEEKSLCEIALNKDKNVYFRERGFSGFAIIDLETGYEMYWCTLAK